MTSWQAFLVGFAVTFVPNMGFYLVLRERPIRRRPAPPPMTAEQLRAFRALGERAFGRDRAEWRP